MTRYEILIAMEEVGAAMFDLMPKTYEGVVDVFERFAAIVRAKEREQCAKVCDEIAQRDETGYGIAEDCAAAIRARNNVQQEPQSKD